MLIKTHSVCYGARWPLDEAEAEVARRYLNKHFQSIRRLITGRRNVSGKKDKSRCQPPPTPVADEPEPPKMSTGELEIALPTPGPSEGLAGNAQHAAPRPTL